MAAVDVFVAHAEALRAEHEGDARAPRRASVREMLARRAGRRAEVARRHRRGAQRSVMPSSASASVATMRAPASTSVAPLAIATVSSRAQHVGTARRHQHQVGKAHHLHRPRRRAHVAGVAGADQDEAGRVGAGMTGRVKSRIIARVHLRRARSFLRQPVPLHAASGRTMSQALHPMLNIAIKAARAAGAIINRASLDLDLLQVSTKGPNDFVTEVDHAAEQAIIETLLGRLPRPRHPGRGIGPHARREGQRLRLDHRSAGRHHQLHPRLPGLCGVDRAGLPRPGAAGRRLRPDAQRPVLRLQGPRRLPQRPPPARLQAHPPGRLRSSAPASRSARATTSSATCRCSRR